MKLYFCNQGEIDLHAALTFGVSAKECDTPIGHFGTGLKYAIACTLRAGAKITVHEGDKAHAFTTRSHSSRGTEFDVVHLGEQSLGFTTHLGVHWEPWQVYRELLCNALDEGGYATTVRAEAKPGTPGTTVVEVTGWEDLLDAHANRGEIVLQDAPRWDLGSVQVHDRPSQHVFYRGIRVVQLHFDKGCKYTYNLMSKQQLTEDRTLGNWYNAEAALRDALLQCEDASLLTTILSRPSGSFEQQIAWGSVREPSETFKEVATQLSRDPTVDLNGSLLEIVKRYRGAATQYKTVKGTPSEQQQLERAVRVCAAIGHPVDRYEIILADSLGAGCYGKAVDGKILLSRLAFNVGPRCVVGTLLEEYIHLTHHLHDETRALQNYLVDLAAGLAEEVAANVLLADRHAGEAGHAVGD